MLRLDRHLEHWIASHRVDWVDHVSLFLSRIGTVGLIWIVIALAFAALQRRPTLALWVVTAVASADLLTYFLKLVIPRHRPFEHQIGPSERTHSFPSGHTATAFAGATMLSSYLPRYRAAFYALAVLIGLSRLYNGVHYPTDVLAGAVFGTGTALLLLAAVRRRSGERAEHVG